MKVSAVKITGDQQGIWPWVGDRAFATLAETRTAVGDFFEETARVMFGAQRHQIDSTADVCPDLSLGRNRFLECKAIGNRCQGLLFAHRLQRDRALIDATSGALTYLFFVHGVAADKCGTLRELQARLGAGIKFILAVPFERLELACREMKPCVVRGRAAYRPTMRALRRMASSQTFLTWQVQAFGADVLPTALHCDDIRRLRP